MNSAKTDRSGHHEFSASGVAPKKIGSDRAFGVVFTVVFLFIALKPLLEHLPPRPWALAAAAALALIALARPSILNPANRAWSKLGFLLHAIVSPVLMRVLFYLGITPMAFLIRLLGKDLLRLNFDSTAETYWIPREPPGPSPDSLANQF